MTVGVQPDADGGPLTEGPAGTVRVVVLDVRGEDCFEVTAAEDGHPVEALAPEGPDHGFRTPRWPEAPGAGSDYIDDPRCDAHSIDGRVTLVS